MLRMILLMLICSASVSAATLVDGSTGDEIVMAIATIGENDLLILPEQELILPAHVEAEVLLLIRANFSPSYTHYALLPPGNTSQIVIVRPAAVVVGQVKNTRENLLAHAPVRIICPSAVRETQTDEAGAFYAVLPAEECVVSAEHRSVAGSIDVSLEPGTTERVLVTIESDVSTSASYNALPLVLLIALLVGAGLVYLLLRPKRYTAERAKPMLKPNEAAIVDALMIRGGTATLSSLRSALHMPRTSLLRTLQNLEQRNVLQKKEEYGKITIHLLK